MITHLKGILEYKGLDYVIIDVNGIGFYVNMAEKNITTLQINSDIKILTYLYLREDIVQLFGFLDNLEVELFQHLLSVSGIGPKAALAILSTCNCEEIIYGITNERYEIFTKVYGVGKKTAQRIIIDLKEKIKQYENYISAEINEDVLSTPLKSNTVIEETIDALINLGYNIKEVKNLVYDVYKDSENQTVEKMLPIILKKLASPKKVI